MRNKWFVAYKERGEDLFDMEGFTIIEPPPMKYQADPFSFSYGDKRYLFIEDYDYKLGEIACAELTEDGVGEFKTIISDDYHFSYPFIFEHDNQIWMIPETGRKGRIELFRCLKFPDKWERVKTLIEAPGADSTIFNIDGTLCLFTNLGNDNNVTIFTSNNLLGEWKYHSTNTHPHSRSAGNVFLYEDRLIRPTQDCSKCYGHALVFKEIRLTESVYEERVFKRIEPDWHPGLIGTHTFNFDDKYVYVDGKVQVEE